MEYAAFIYSLSADGIFAWIFVCWSRIAALSDTAVWLGTVFLGQLFYGSLWLCRNAACLGFFWLTGIGNIALFPVGCCTGVGGVFSIACAVFWERAACRTGVVWQGLLAALLRCDGSFAGGSLRRPVIYPLAV